MSFGMQLGAFIVLDVAALMGVESISTHIMPVYRQVTVVDHLSHLALSLCTNVF